MIIIDSIDDNIILSTETTTAKRKINKKNSQASMLVSTIQYLLNSNKLTYHDINKIILFINPAQITSTRIALSAALGMQLAIDSISIYYITLLEVIAYKMYHDILISPQNNIDIVINYGMHYYAQTFSYLSNFETDISHYKDKPPLNTNNIIVGNNELCDIIFSHYQADNLIEIVQYKLRNQHKFQNAEDLCNF
ncbi:MAG: hypothetical protein OEY79_00930 [Anaplasmataceae bacterium]|nr:hypothetical protein [Candidatus Heimdallarchaeota archaeon]MDH5796092.1 hypothetical protein [Anaplasmataceae bacterium]